MASPQKENGFTPISNEIMEALARTRISGESRQVLDVIIRKTYGFHKSEDRIALSQLCLGTGLKKNTVCRAINKLEEMKLITKKETDAGNIFKFQKDFDTWNPLPKKRPLPKKGMTVPKKENRGYSKKRHTKDTITKDNTKDKASQSDADIPVIINLFKEVNPSYQRLFGMPPQRAAAERLKKVHGMEKLTSMIAYLPKSNTSKYAPTITTPVQFEQELGKLIAWAAKEKQGKGKGIISSVE